MQATCVLVGKRWLITDDTTRRECETILPFLTYIFHTPSIHFSLLTKRRGIKDFNEKFILFIISCGLLLCGDDGIWSADLNFVIQNVNRTLTCLARVRFHKSIGFRELVKSSSGLVTLHVFGRRKYRFNSFRVVWYFSCKPWGFKLSFQLTQYSAITMTSPSLKFR